MIRGALAAAASGLLLAAPGAAAAAPAVHAHRGGPFVAGRATYAEETLPAFRAAAQRGFVLELDTRVTQDGVIALHDATLDRTTPCSGRAADMTMAAIAACPSDVLGSPGSILGWRPKEGGPPPPPLADVLALARRQRVTVNVELNDFDGAGPATQRVLDVIAAAGLPRRRLIVQSFFAPNLALARQRLPGAALTMLTLKASQADAIAAARAARATWVSPQWPVPRSFVRRAHRANLKVVPFTLDTRFAVRTAARIGVDALITDDPVMARRALRRR
ncbi:MAG TPA: glycerophosphodiester phosphodiesterase [Solirubrobacteraceae bacterium]|nr:glycerophosphodiester phosphodiesterase [Solirubrobacteraceae bacterium]